MPAIVIIGAGVAGLDLSLYLQKHLATLPADYEVILIDKRSFYFHLVGSLRALVDDATADQVCIPFDKLFTAPSCKGRMRVVQASVTKIEDDAVICSDGKRIAYAQLVLATGCTWQHQLDVPKARTAALQYLSEQRRKIQEAPSVVVVGGGAVGVELAGEVAASAKQAGRTQQVTLVHRNEKGLLSEIYPEKLRRSLKDQVEALGVTVLLGADADLRQEGDETRLEALEGGQEGMADKLKGALVLVTVGGKPNTDLMRGFAPSAVDKDGVKVNKYFQVEGQRNVFCVGDAARIPNEQKQAAKISQGHVPALGPILVSMALQGEVGKKSYGGQNELIIVTVGPSGGAGWLFGFNVGAWVSKFAKSKGLFISPTRAKLGY